MQLRYLYHSGFSIEGDNFTMVIDYYSDTSSGERIAQNGVIDKDTFARAGKLYVLSSHIHADHFNPVILRWAQKKQDIQYIFSFDIEGEAEGAEPAVYLNVGDIFEDERIKIKAFGSTDAGISFLIDIDGKRIFHAGDLNNWHWNEEVDKKEADGYEKDYLAELEKIKEYTDYMDLAMFPVDPRLGKDYMLGAQQFVQNIKTKAFVPMHFGEKFEAANAFRAFAEKHNIRFLELLHRGQTYGI